MVIGYLIAWTPYSLGALVTAFHPTFPYNPRLYLAVVLIAKTSYIYNSFIYIFVNKKVNNDLQSVCSKLNTGISDRNFSSMTPSGFSSVSCFARNLR